MIWHPAAPRSAGSPGSSTHGASIIGSVSEEIDPSVVSTRGDSAKATAPISRDVGLPMFSASATRSSPQQPGGQQHCPPHLLGHSSLAR